MRVENHLHDLRSQRGLSASELAKAAGVTRQTIYAMEAGSYVPNTAVALKIARMLEVPVERVFSLDEEPARRESPLRVYPLGGSARSGQSVRLCRVGSRMMAVAAPPFPAMLPVADAIVSGSHKVRPLSPAAELNERLLVAGCDPAISLLSQRVREDSGIELVPALCSSTQALEWLRESRVHIAGIHLTHAGGEWNDAAVRRFFPRGGVRLVTFASWQQGLVVARGNPKKIRHLTDAVRKNVRIVNRERGAGARMFLDDGLKSAGVLPRRVLGYNDITRGHLDAAAHVANCSADCCVATLAAARLFGLDFVPLLVERYDFVIPRKFFRLHAVQETLNALNRLALRRELEALGGYDTSRTGTVLC